MIELKRDLLFIRDDGSKYIAKAFFCYDFANHDLDVLRSVLHPEELQKYNSLPSSKSKQNFLLGRFCAKKALSNLVKINQLSEVLILNGVFGQPILCYSGANNWQISIAHSDKMAVAVVFEEKHPVAIDIEEIKDEWQDDILRQTFAKAELELLNQANIPKNIFYFILWTAKEALSKVLKTGLMMSPALSKIDTISPAHAMEAEFYSTYRNFGQYIAFSYLIGGHVCSLVFPKNSRLVGYSISRKN